MEVPVCIARVIAAYRADSQMLNGELRVALYNERTARAFYKLVSLDYTARLDGNVVIVDMRQPTECKDG